jgi:hypothetical protein
MKASATGSKVPALMVGCAVEKLLIFIRFRGPEALNDIEERTIKNTETGAYSRGRAQGRRYTMGAASLLKGVSYRRSIAGMETRASLRNTERLA